MNYHASDRRDFLNLGIPESLSQDACDLFSGRRSGHVGGWFYGAADAEDDPSYGQKYWEALADQSTIYDVSSGEECAVEKYAQSDICQVEAASIVTVREYGPGTERSVRSKTIPILKSLPRVKTYIAVDLNEAFARSAANIVTAAMDVGGQTEIRNFHERTLKNLSGTENAVLAFDIIANVSGRDGEKPNRGLSTFFKNAINDIGEKGVLISGYNSETNGDKVLPEYTDSAYYALLSSFFHRLSREIGITGRYDPYAWQIERKWNAHSSQLCHMAYSTQDQKFSIGNEDFFIPAGRRIHLSNSYRFNPAEIERASLLAGFSTVRTVSCGHSNLLIARL